MTRDREPRIVPYGYEEPQANRKGTLIYYDTFDEVSEDQLTQAAECAERRAFTQLVLYPLHEQTYRRMSNESIAPYHKRVDRLHDWRRSQPHLHAAIEGWEGKRKRYTPIDSALRHLTEHYASPHMLLVSPDMANRFASYASFEEWIVKLRLLLTEVPRELHPKLVQFEHRWGTVNDSSTNG